MLNDWIYDCTLWMDKKNKNLTNFTLGPHRFLDLPSVLMIRPQILLQSQSYQNLNYYFHWKSGVFHRIWLQLEDIWDWHLRPKLYQYRLRHFLAIWPKNIRVHNNLYIKIEKKVVKWLNLSLHFVIWLSNFDKKNKNFILPAYIPYARHYKPLVYFLPHLSVRFIIKSG